MAGVARGRAGAGVRGLRGGAVDPAGGGRGRGCRAGVRAVGRCGVQRVGAAARGRRSWRAAGAAGDGVVAAAVRA